MTYQTIALDAAPGSAAADGIRVLTLCRPEVLNAMNTLMFTELGAALHALAGDEALRVLVLAGAGGRAFSSGGDLKERDGMSDAAWRAQHRLIEEAFLAVKDFPVPVIAAVEGHAHGGGCELALMADFVVASDHAVFSLAEVRRGLLPGGGGVQNLVRAAGMRRAKQLLYTGDAFGAAEAHAWGVVNEVAAAGQALAAALAVARRIAAAAPLAVRQAKLAASRGGEVDFHTGYALDLAAYAALVPTEDRREGVRAFNEKRAAALDRRLNARQPAAAARRDETRPSPPPPAAPALPTRGDPAMTSRRRVVAGAALLAAPALWSAPLRAAEPYPSRLVTLLVPQAAGGANDVIARALAQKLSGSIGAPVIVENRPGAGGNVGTQYVARQPKDGYTLLLNAQSVQTINPFLYGKPGFDPVKDFEPVMTVGVAPYLLAVHPAFPAKNLRELIALAKAQPGRINYASAGNGTVNHLLGEMLKTAAGIDLVHVPYRGAAAAATDVVAGQVPITFGSFPGLMPFVRGGQLRALAVATEKRSALAPELPTLAETVPGLHANAWYGLFAPAGTPREIVARLHAEISKALEGAEMKERLAGLGVEAAPSTPEQLAALMKDDLARWARIVRESGAHVD